jgi:hypothetical protein
MLALLRNGALVIVVEVADMMYRHVRHTSLSKEGQMQVEDCVCTSHVILSRVQRGRIIQIYPHIYPLWGMVYSSVIVYTDS